MDLKQASRLATHRCPQMGPPPEPENVIVNKYRLRPETSLMHKHLAKQTRLTMIRICMMEGKYGNFCL